jgi:tripartite-type tricarboxylate transporter receptor subunit TctC
MHRRAFCAGVAAGAAVPLAAPRGARGQGAWPGTRPVRILSPSPAGTPQDFYARSLAEHWMRALGGTFVVENRPGASGTIGMAAVANAPPDGWTLSFNSNTAQTIAPQLMRDAGFDPLRSFAPVFLVYRYGMVLIANPAIPARGAREFVAWARARTDRVNMGTVGPGSGGHLMGERVRIRGGFAAEPVHYRGSPPSLLAVAQGECHYTVDSVGSSAALVREGRLRLLALTGRARTPAAPEVPTLAEEGFPGFVEEIWFGVSAPAGAPRAVVERLNAEANRWLASGEIRARMAGLAHEPMGGAPEAFAEFAAWDREVWAAVVRETGVRLE